MTSNNGQGGDAGQWTAWLLNSIPHPHRCAIAVILNLKPTPGPATEARLKARNDRTSGRDTVTDRQIDRQTPLIAAFSIDTLSKV
jgi:hypothetical protein